MLIENNLVLSPSFSLAAIGVSTGSCPSLRGLKLIGCHNLFFVAGSDESFMVVTFWLAGMTDFDLSAYLGQWYEYSNMFEIYQDVFAGSPITDTVGVKNEYVSPL